MEVPETRSVGLDAAGRGTGTDGFLHVRVLDVTLAGGPLQDADLWKSEAPPLISAPVSDREEQILFLCSCVFGSTHPEQFTC